MCPEPTHSNSQRPSRAATAFVRTTITVPRELKARMEQVGDRVNWSAVASRAFEAYLAELESKEPAVPELPDKEHALERLRKLKSQPEARELLTQGRGYLLGKHWAMADAHPNELQRLEDFCQAHGLDQPASQWKLGYLERRAFKDLFRRLTLSILGCERLEDLKTISQQARVFWQQRVGVTLDASPRPDFQFVSQFTRGALDFWREAKSQL